MTFSYQHLKKGIAHPSIQFFSEHIIVNGRKIELFSSQKRVKSIKIIDTKNSAKKLLEFDIQWATRKGPTNDEFRFLIPQNKIEEAEQMVENYSKM